MGGGRVRQGARALHLAVEPPTLVAAAVGEVELAQAVPLVLRPVARVGDHPGLRRKRPQLHPEAAAPARPPAQDQRPRSVQGGRGGGFGSSRRRVVAPAQSALELPVVLGAAGPAVRPLSLRENDMFHDTQSQIAERKTGGE